MRLSAATTLKTFHLKNQRQGLGAPFKPYLGLEWDIGFRLWRNRAQGGKATPQGLKPDVFSIPNGPTKVVP